LDLNRKRKKHVQRISTNILDILDNREYKKMRNGDATSPLIVPTLYIYKQMKLKFRIRRIRP